MVVVIGRLQRLQANLNVLAPSALESTSDVRRDDGDPRVLDLVRRGTPAHGRDRLGWCLISGFGAPGSEVVTERAVPILEFTLAEPLRCFGGGIEPARQQG